MYVGACFGFVRCKVHAALTSIARVILCVVMMMRQREAMGGQRGGGLLTRWVERMCVCVYVCWCLLRVCQMQGACCFDQYCARHIVCGDDDETEGRNGRTERRRVVDKVGDAYVCVCY